MPEIVKNDYRTLVTHSEPTGKVQGVNGGQGMDI